MHITQMLRVIYVKPLTSFNVFFIAIQQAKCSLFYEHVQVRVIAVSNHICVILACNFVLAGAYKGPSSSSSSSSGSHSIVECSSVQGCLSYANAVLKRKGLILELVTCDHGGIIRMETA